MPGNTQRNPYGSERSIYGRAGKVYLDGDWVATATEVSATITVDNMEIRRAGDYWLRHKAGQITGEGSMSIEKVNSSFEKQFIDYINSNENAIRSYVLQMTLDDPGMPNPERISLQEVTFWSTPVGFSIDDIVKRDLDFNFYGISLDSEIGTPEAGTF